jgi:hypothetical protein
LKLSEESTFSSFNNKGLDKSKLSQFYNSFNFTKIDGLFHFNSANVLFSKFDKDFDLIKKEKNIVNKSINKGNYSIINNNNKNLSSKEKETKNYIDNKSELKAKNEMQNNKSNIIKKVDKRKIISQRISKKSSENSNSESYSQEQNIVKYMKELAPKIPDIYDYVYNVINKDCLSKKNEALGVIDKSVIPIVFYHHLMVGVNKKISQKEKKCKYHRNSMTQRNKKKKITFIYYSPK